MINQYTSNSTVSAQIQNIVANKVSLLDKYIIMQTAENEYTALVYNPNSKECKEYEFYRDSSSSYNNRWNVRESISEFEYNVTNEYYVYSNLGIGQSLNLPVYDGVISYSLVIISCVLMFAIIFKGALFKCLRK